MDENDLVTVKIKFSDLIYEIQEMMSDYYDGSVDMDDEIEEISMAVAESYDRGKINKSINSFCDSAEIYDLSITEDVHDLIEYFLGKDIPEDEFEYYPMKKLDMISAATDKIMESKEADFLYCSERFVIVHYA